VATGFAYDPVFLSHDTGPGHAERPERLRSIVSRLTESGTLAKLVAVAPSVEPDEWILAVHPPEHVSAVREACERARSGTEVLLDPDTPVSGESFAAARRAVSAVLTACDAVARGELTNSFCAVRPPGHHAETARPMGFCLFNNVAAGARFLQKRHGLARVLVVDWDVHHGNGTQEIFWRDPSVFYYSIHQFPFYPGTGAADERGEGPGLGATLNSPMPAGSGDDAWLARMERDLVPAARAFRPDFILISAGFDAHASDPLAEMRLTEDGFGRMSELLCGLARELCGGKLVSVLEGGYDLAALGASVEAHIKVLRTSM
jgi:acetoin utilization deacetylase AcuC-like enzyme